MCSLQPVKLSIPIAKRMNIFALMPGLYHMAICNRSGHIGLKVIGRESAQLLHNVTQTDDIICDGNITPVVLKRAYRTV